MFHPGTMLKFVDHAVGYGVFATEFIPRERLPGSKIRLIK